MRLAALIAGGVLLVIALGTIGRSWNGHGGASGRTNRDMTEAIRVTRQWIDLVTGQVETAKSISDLRAYERVLPPAVQAAEIPEIPEDPDGQEDRRIAEIASGTRVRGIMMQTSKPMAMLNDELVGTGDHFGPFIVVAIESNRVWMADAKQRFYALDYYRDLPTIQHP